jgi:hypothetical protein
VGPYGGTITIPTSNGLDIDAVSLLTVGTETHAYNSDQRLVWLQIQNKTATEVVVSAPINANIAPPGFYYIFILKRGIPSVASAIKIPGLTPPQDTAIPTVDIVSPAVDEVLTGEAPAFAVNVTGTAADVGSGLQIVEVSVDAGPFTAATGTDTWSFTTPVLTEGVHTINARAKDNAGNISEIVMRSFTIQITTGGTFVSVYSVAGQNSYGTIYSTGSSGAGEKLSAASSLVGTAIKRVAVILKKAGNTTGTINVRIRNSSDAIVKEIGTIDASLLTAADQRFELTASSTYILQANDKVLIEWAGTGSAADIISVKRHNVDNFDDANTYFVVRNATGSYTNHSTRDLAGDWYYESSTPLDTILPTINIVTPVAEEVLTGAAPGIPVTVTGTASDAQSGLQVVEVSVDAGPFTAATGTDSWSFTTPVLTAGSHAITARAKDNAGNIAENTVNITIEVTTSGNFVPIYTAAGSNSYGVMSSTGAASDFTGIGEKLTSSSSLINSAIKRVKVTLKKSGNTSGTMISIRIRNSSGAIVKEIGTIDGSALTSADQEFTVTASTAYILKANDVVLVEWGGTGSLSDVVSVKRSGTDIFDGVNTFYVARKASGSYTNTTTRDLAGEWSYET